MSCIDAVFQTLQSQVLGQNVYYMKKLKILHWAPPPSRLSSWLPEVMHVTFSQAFPPLFLQTASDQKLEVGTAWERGYHTPVHMAYCSKHDMPHKIYLSPPTLFSQTDNWERRVFER